MDLTRLATPVYFATMALERRQLARRAAERGPARGDYERPDTLTSLTMGTLSLGLPLVTRRLVRAFAPGAGRWARGLAGATAAAAVATTVADRVVRRARARAAGTASPDGAAPGAPGGEAAPALVPAAAATDPHPEANGAAPARPEPDGTSAAGGEELRPAAPPETNGAAARTGTGATGPTPHAVAPVAGADPAPAWALAVQKAGGVAAVAGAVVLATAAAAHRTSPSRLWRRGRRRDLGAGPLAWAVAVLGWDFIYYWNHRLMHEVRLLWAHHVVHHSSERYNLSTALRQPVSPFGVWVPYGLLSWLGVRPSLVEQARGVNLLYQYWIHTELVDRLGPGEEVLNTPSHHRVHHGSNKRYLDRNHGSILIVWDRLFGTFEREDPSEPVVYGLTRNVGSYHPVRVATHEYVDMVRDIARSDNWRDRISYVLRGPGWAYRRRAEQLAAGGAGAAPAPARAA